MGIDSMSPGPRDHLITSGLEQELDRLDPEVRVEVPLVPPKAPLDALTMRCGRSSGSSPSTRRPLARLGTRIGTIRWDSLAREWPPIASMLS